MKKALILAAAFGLALPAMAQAQDDSSYQSQNGHFSHNGESGERGHGTGSQYGDRAPMNGMQDMQSMGSNSDNRRGGNMERMGNMRGNREEGDSNGGSRRENRRERGSHNHQSRGDNDQQDGNQQN
ncbi:hypothetical protein [Acetobacter tropicalis]|uniref:Uncharacterized protein n=1 Tax=Acetobacter tropicalis TaxID=104102 RepID=A0A252ABY1_9PROT|nr:hypothetical protein [Acetobacter tropicalis]OUI87096.1 hypothetical protein HC62_01460 [Acetobacter tropicalis]